MHVFQPLPPEKLTFFSHFHLKNTRFSATSAQKTHVKQQQHSTPYLISQWPQQQQHSTPNLTPMNPSCGIEML
jgi:hypothetical protein